jgi:Na+-driven multidrug efflux pump
LEHVTWTGLVRITCLLIASCNVTLALVAIKHARALRQTQPDGSMAAGINVTAYLAIGIAGVQVVAWQINRLQAEAPLVWWSAPLSIVWQGMLCYWFLQRVRWHRRQVFPAP